MGTPKLRLADGGKRQPRRARFTKKLLDSIPAPPRGRLHIYDEATPSLVFIVTPSGSRSFARYGRIDGKPTRLKIGDYPAWTIHQARAKVAELQGDIARGMNPAEERRSKRAEITFAELFTHYMEHHAKRHKRTWAEDEQKYNLHLADWKRRKVSSIRRADVQAKMTAIGTGDNPRPGAANRLLALVSCVFNIGIRDLDLPINNPARGVRKFEEHRRERYLRADELAAFYKSLNEEPDARLRGVFELAILTGQRRGAIAAMEWREVDIDAAIWSVPAGKMKGKRSVTVPLVTRAVEILRERWEENQRREIPHTHVFPNKRCDCKKPHIRETRKGWERLVARAGLQGVRLHDLRHTAASWMTATGAPLQVVSKALAHQSTRTTEGYSHVELAPIRAAMEAATDAMQQARQAAEGGE